MTEARTYHLTGALTAGSAFVVYALTAPPTVSYWTNGAWTAAAQTVGVVNPPGNPLFVLLLRAAGLIPFPSDVAWRTNLLSGLISAVAVYLTVLLTYRIVKNILQHRMEGNGVALSSGVIAGLTLAFTLSFWQNAIHVEPENTVVLFTALLLLLTVTLFESPKTETWIVLLSAYVFGLATGVSWTVLLLLFPIAGAFAWRYHDVTRKTFFVVGVLSFLLFLFAFPGITVFLPAGVALVNPELPAVTALFGSIAVLIALVLFLGMLLSYTRLRKWALLLSMSIVLFILGYSTHGIIPLRASHDTAMNMGEASDAERLAGYFHAGTSRSGDSPVDRRWKTDTEMIPVYARYDSDFSFFFRHQLFDSFVRYFFWNFIGKEHPRNGSEPYLLGLFTATNGEHPEALNYPIRYYGIPLFVGAIGLIWLMKNGPMYGTLLMAVILLFGLGTVFFLNDGGVPSRETDGLFVPAIFAFSVAIGAGAASIMSRFVNDTSSRAVVIASFIIFLALVPGNILLANWKSLDRSDDFTAKDFAYNLLQSCERNAILFTHGDNDTYPLLYLQTVEGVRRDVRVVNLGFISSPWYNRQITKHRVTGSEPVLTSFSPDELETLPRMTPEALRRVGLQSDKKEMRVPVELEVGLRFIRERREGISAPLRDTLAPRRSPSFMSYVVHANIPVSVNPENTEMRFYRPWRDVMVDDIIRTNAWTYPVYFSIMCPPDVYNRMIDYLRLDGLAMRVTPLRINDGSNVAYSILRKHLLYPTGETHREPSRGFRFSNMNGSTICAEGPAQEIVMNYRRLFMRLASFAQLTLHDSTETIRILGEMERKIPEAYLPQNFRFLFDQAVLYHEAGARSRFKTLARRVTDLCWHAINRHPDQPPTIYSPYRYLLDIHQMEHNYRGMMEVLNIMAKRFPQAEDIRLKQEEIRQLIGMN